MRTAMSLIMMCVAATGADAQSSRKHDWSDLLKPYDAKTKPSEPQPEAPTAAPMTAIEECKQAWRLGIRDKIIVRSFFDAFGNAVVVVDDASWNKFPFGTKQGVALAARCGMSDGDSSIQHKLEIRSYLTNKLLRNYPFDIGTPNC